VEKNPVWGNRVVGHTDELHNALKVNPKTLKPDQSKGVNILPSHVHLALRQYLGLEGFANEAGFRLDVESLPLFDRSRSTI